MSERLSPSTNTERSLDDIAPCAVRIECHLDLIAVCPERIFEERRRADAIAGLAALGGEEEPVRVGIGLPRGYRHLPSRDGDGLKDEPGRGLPQPKADLFVKGDVLF